MNRTRRPQVLLGVTGSVAAIKAPELAGMLSTFAEVRVIATGSALRFFNVHQLPVACRRIYGDEDEWREWRGKGDPIMHIELRKWADVLVVAPLSANSLAKGAQGLCDNLLTCILRAWDFSKPCLAAPAMNTAMWNHPLTGQQLSAVQGFGWLIIDPVSKQLACGDVGYGAMEAPSAIADAVGRSAHEYLMRPQPFPGTGQPQVPSIVDAFERAIPPQMRQRPIGAAATRPPVPSPRGGTVPLNHFAPGMNGGYVQDRFDQDFGDFGNFGMGPPTHFHPISVPPVNSFVKSTSSEFGVGEISAKRPRNEAGL
ncbi:hypothetical protein WJX74_001200 [Apatococcus lobatus]|uniref:phosphopantothenoylcysteine decarboxylase n=2 Tax=Apatococcus TaxID=904362 RepID=A0AAW1TBQ2_9CHLO